MDGASAGGTVPGRYAYRAGAKLSDWTFHLRPVLNIFVLKVVWQEWKGVAHAVGTFQARILLTIFYGVLVLPFGIFVRTAADAFLTFSNSEMDSLILENFLLDKN